MKSMLFIFLFTTKIVYSGYTAQDRIDEIKRRIKLIPTASINMAYRNLLPISAQNWLQSKCGMCVNIQQLLTTKKAITLPTLSCLIKPFNKDHHGTQTEYHGYANFIPFIALLQHYKKKLQLPDFQNMLNQAFTKELEEHKKGKYIFSHGRKLPPNLAWNSLPSTTKNSRA